MTTRHQMMQRIMRLYREQTGASGIDMDEVARFAVKMGMPLPEPSDPYAALAKQFAQAAREEIKYDKWTGQPYRVNHAVPGLQGRFNWYDIDTAPRAPMVTSLINRRQQMVADGWHLTLDADHWNAIHSDELPIQIPMDFTQDIEWKKNAPGEQAG